VETFILWETKQMSTRSKTLTDEELERNGRPANLIIAVIGSILLCFSALAADTGKVPEKIGTEPPYFEVPNNDVAMQAAVIEARKTIGQFIVAVKHPAQGQEDFEIKKPFIQNGQVEHIWLSDVRFVGNRFQGRVDNRPRKIQGLKVGQIVSVNPNEISDWLYLDHGKLVGGYTVRVQYNELSAKEKEEIDHEADFKIRK
jgi:uncharacterized protein YegJ (DUF2314 family)